MTQDDAHGYGTISRAFHWMVAALLAWQIGGMILKQLLGRTPLMGFWVGTHASVGTLLLVLVLLRAAWALGQRSHCPVHPSGTLGRLATLGHLGLYALMLIVPSLAVLRMVGGTRPIALFGMGLRGPTTDPVPWMTAPANLAHGTLAWLLLALILDHVAMALVHHLVWKDGTLGLMLARVRTRRARADATRGQ